jgi:Ca-activated chloride channel family protein
MRLHEWAAAVFLSLATATAQPVAPKDARLAFDKAGAEVKSGRPDDALRDYRQAVELFPAYAEAWYEMGKLLLEHAQFNHNELDTARRALESSIQADPKYAAPYLVLAAIENAQRRWPQLIDLTNRLLQFDSIDYPFAWLLNAVGYYNTHNLVAAEKSAREAQRIDAEKKFPDTSRILGMILAQRGDFAGAATQFRAYLKAAPLATDADAVRAKLADAEKRAGSSADLQQATGDSDATPTFSSNVNLSVVPFQFFPRKGDPPRDLRREDIEMRENGVVQPVAIFAPLGAAAISVPVEITLLFDCSASVDHIGVLNPNTFRENLLDQFPNVSVAVYGFSDTLVRFATPTRDPATLKNAMDRVASIPARGTPLFGSIAAVVENAGTTGPNVVRMLVIFSDGESESPGDELLAGEASKAAEKSGMALFPVILNKPGASGSMESAESVSDFAKLAAETGGHVLQGHMGDDVLPSILKALTHEIQQDYVAGYYMDTARKPKSRQIKVALAPGVRGKVYGGARTVEIVPAGR